MKDMHDWESCIDVPSTCCQRRREGRLGSGDLRLGYHLRCRRQFQAVFLEGGEIHIQHEVEEVFRLEMWTRSQGSESREGD